MLARVALCLVLTFAELSAGAAPMSAQTVGAAGQPPPKPGRFGFSLECVAGCAWVEPGIDHAYFRFRGSPRVSQVAPKSAAQRAGLKAGDLVTDVNGFLVSSQDAGLLLASDTVQSLTVRLERAGKPRELVLFSPQECRGMWGVIVGNRTGAEIEVLMGATQGDKTRLLGRAPPGESVLPIALTDSAYRATPRYVYGRFIFRNDQRRQGAARLLELNSYRVVCHD